MKTHGPQKAPSVSFTPEDQRITSSAVGVLKRQTELPDSDALLPPQIALPASAVAARAG